MLRNLLTIAIRNLFKNRLYSLINVFGLTIGITCSLFLLLYILDELSYDRYNENADRIYRVVSDIHETDNAFVWSVAQIPLADELRDNYPEVENAVRFFGLPRTLYVNQEKEFYEDDFYLADSTVFDMFSYKFLAGDPSTALDEPNTIVLTESIAKKYFGDEQALSNAMETKTGDEYKVTGVIEDVPLNSHFRFDALISRSTNPDYQGSWGNFGVFTYIQLPKGYELAKMDTALAKVIKEKVDPVFEQYGIKIKYVLQKITDIHLRSKIQDEAEAGGDMSYIYIFGAVALFMLLIATINYMNLATARSATRAREVGIRKVMGSQRLQLIGQFIVESVVIVLIALVMSLVFIYALLPLFNELANKSLPFSSLLRAPVILSLLGIVLITGIVGGSYPAFYLSSFNAVNVLKGKLSTQGGSAFLRKALVVVQFAISIFMLVSTLIVFDQLSFVRNKDLGFDKERVIRLPLSGDELQRRSPALAEALRRNPDVAGVGMSNTSPGQGIGKLLLKVEDSQGKMVDRGIDLFAADYDYLDVMGMQIVKGRNFSRDYIADTLSSVLVNESMVKRMAWEDPIGKKFEFGPQGPNGAPNVVNVIGVVKDYNQNSLYDVIEPLMIFLRPQCRYVFVKTRPGDVRKALASVEGTWKEINPSYPFEYVFLDADFNSQYKADEKRSQIFTVFSGLTILIACLGLLGLVAFTTQQRTKEIGIRKVVGASINNLVWLISREFILLVLIGMVIAFPVSWYFTDSWLQNFAYRIELDGEYGTFILCVGLGMIITFLTVGFHVLAAAIANPVKALREE